VNKVDLKDQAAFGEEQVKQATEAFDAPFFYSSAKTRENVENVFRSLGETITKAGTSPEA